jgi:beta-mannosidase
MIPRPMLYKYIIILCTGMLCVMASITYQKAMAQKATLLLHQQWEFRQHGSTAWMQARVPGSVHTDLLENKIIKDPYFGIHEKEQQWIGEKDWEYRTRFDLAPEILNKENLKLEFEGLDTYADVYLNGEKILVADNMHRTWQIDCKGKLKPKDNLLYINFHSVFKSGMALKNSYPIPLYQYANNDQTSPDSMISLFVRKAGYHFGWDWGPRFITSGIWKNIKLIAYDALNMESIHISTSSIANEKADMLARFEIVSDKEDDGLITLSADGIAHLKEKVKLKQGVNIFHFPFIIKSPKLWWSNGLGPAHLYHFTATISNPRNISDTHHVTTGIRTIRIINKADNDGKSLYVELNGRPVFMKGANYIPTDMFTNRTTDAQYSGIIQSAAAANMNMLRVWGGGYFEKEIFYNLCDQYGILIWQDMLFACGTYPGTEHFYESVTNEIKDNIKRIRNHPSIALYNGNNEVDVAYYAWTWKEKYSKEQQQYYEKTLKKLFSEVIPTAIFSEDTTRYYHPTSPNTGYNDIGFQNGDVHYWNVWHGKEPFESFNSSIGRFMSEYGFQSYPLEETVKTFTLPADRNLESEVMQAHQRCMADEMKDKTYGNRLIKHYMDQYYHEPKDFESYLYVSQLLQKKGLAMAIEAHRRAMPFCMGTLYWQFNDCWPVASWSTMDYEGVWKAAHYKVKELYQSRMISIWKKQDSIEVHIANDALKGTSEKLKITLLHMDGKVLWKTSVPVALQPNTSNIYYSMPTKALIKNYAENELILTAELEGNDTLSASGTFYFVPEKMQPLKNPNIKHQVTRVNDKFKIVLTSNTLAREVYISFPGEKGLYDKNFVDLLPGKKIEIIFTPGAGNPAPNEKSLTIQSLFDSYQ